MMRCWLSSGKTSRVLRFHFVPKKIMFVLGYTAKFILSSSWVLSLTIAVESGQSKEKTEKTKCSSWFGDTQKLQATRPKERPKNKRVKDTLTLFLTLVYSFTTTTTSNPLEEATWPVLIYHYWSTT